MLRFFESKYRDRGELERSTIPIPLHIAGRALEY
jgi:hypothetical protein